MPHKKTLDLYVLTGLIKTIKGRRQAYISKMKFDKLDLGATKPVFKVSDKAILNFGVSDKARLKPFPRVQKIEMFLVASLDMILS